MQIWVCLIKSILKTFCKEVSLARKTHSIMTQKYCIEINVQLRTPSMFCNNKGSIKTNTTHKRAILEVQNQKLFYTRRYNLTNEIICKIPM